MSEKREKPFDAQAVNPRYLGMKLSDAARVLTRPRSPAARAALDRIQRRSATTDNVPDEPPAVKPAL